MDNVLYSCDFSEKMAPTPPSSIVAKVQSVISECGNGAGPTGGAAGGGTAGARRSSSGLLHLSGVSPFLCSPGVSLLLLKCLTAAGFCSRGTPAAAPVDENNPLAPSSLYLTSLFLFPERHKSRKQEEEPHEEATVMNSQAQGQHRKPCNCKASSSSLIGGSGAGWEGTALLHHGSYIKLGCLQFVFSITEFATKQPKGDTALVQDMDLEEKLSLKPHQVPVLRSNSVP